LKEASSSKRKKVSYGATIEILEMSLIFSQKSALPGVTQTHCVIRKSQ